MAILLQETTVWDSAVPNHTYLLTDTKEFLLGYIPYRSRVLTILKKPIRFDRRYRTFKTIRKIDNALL
jgi:hypothetical protein